MPARHYSIYKQNRSIGRCNYCGKYKICFKVEEVVGTNEEGQAETAPVWSCAKCMTSDQWEYYFT